MTLIFWVIGGLFSIAALLALFRIIRGPSILDRVIASDVLLTTLTLVVGAEMVYNGHTRTIPVMLVLASTAVFATIAVARYVSKQDIASVVASGIAPESAAAVEKDAAEGAAPEPSESPRQEKS